MRHTETNLGKNTKPKLNEVHATCLLTLMATLTAMEVKEYTFCGD